MPPKAPNVKELARQVRTSISNEDWESGRTGCTKILRTDPTNYLIWIYMGMCMNKLQDKDKSIQSYTKAIAIQPDQAPAYQGLVQVFEDIENPSQERLQLLSESLEALIRILPADHPKRRECILQIANVLESLGEITKVVEYLKQAINEEEALDIWKRIFSLLEKHLPDHMNEEYENLIESEIRSHSFDGSEVLQEFVPEYFKRLKTDANLTRQELVNKTCRLVSQIPSFQEGLVFLVELYQEDALRSEWTGEKLNCDIPEAKLIELLTTEYPLLPLAVTYSGIIHEDRSESLKLLEKGLLKRANGKGFLVQATHFLQSGSTRVFDSVTKGLQYIKTVTDHQPQSSFNILRGELLVTMGEAYEKINKDSEAYKVYKRIKGLESSKSVQEKASSALARYCFLHNQYPEAISHFQQLLDYSPSNHWAISHLGWIHFLQDELDQAEEKLKRALELDNQVSIYHYWLAEVYWKKGGVFRSEKHYAQTELLLSAKLNPSFSSAFASLGRLYEHEVKDLERAKRCYQKALSLDPLEELSGKALFELYSQEGKLSEAIKIARQIIQLTTRIEWAWKKMAHYYLSKERFENALTCFQTCLRHSPSDMESLQGLGDTYLQQGMFMAALSVFQRGLQIDPRSLKCLFQLANISLQLGEYSDAVEGFQKALLLEANQPDALWKLCESLFLLAKDQFMEGLFRRCGETLQSTLQAIQNYQQHRASQGNEENPDLWKLLGDVLSYAYNLDDQYLHPLPKGVDFISSNKELLNPVSSSPSSSEEGEHPSSRVIQYLQAGNHAYQEALRGDARGQAMRFFDLGVNWWFQSNYFQRNVLFSGPTDVKGILERSAECFKSAIRLKPTEARFWGALGIVERNPRAKQHLFIRAVEIDPNDANGWCNLLAFYLEHRKNDLARQCCTKVQILDPELERSWTCVGLMNELQGRPKRSQGSSSDLRWDPPLDYYKFANELNSKAIFPKLSVGFVSDPHSKSTSGWYCLTKCVEQQPGNPTSWNHLGVLQENRGLLSSSVDSFRESVRLLENAVNSNSSSGKNSGVELESVFESSLSSLFDLSKVSEEELIRRNWVNLTRARLNLARVLCKVNQFSECLQIYSELGLKSLREQTPFFAWALYQTEESSKRSQAFSILDQWISDCEPSSEQFQSAVHHFCRFAYHDNKIDLAKTKIASCVGQTKSVESWRLMAAIGIAVKDERVSSQCLTQLQTHPSLNYEDILLEASLFVQLGNPSRALKSIQKAIHINPSDLTLRTRYTQLILDYFPQDHTTLLQCVQQFVTKMVSPNFSSQDWSGHLETFGRAVLVIGSTKTLSGEKCLETATRTIQTSLHLHPFNVNARYTACAVAFAKTILLPTSSSVESAIRLLRLHGSFLASRKHPLSHQASWMLFESLLISQRFSDAQELLDSPDDLLVNGKEFFRARLFQAQSKNPEAESSYLFALKSSSSESGDSSQLDQSVGREKIQHALLDFLMETGKFGPAGELIENMIPTPQNSTLSNFDKATILAHLGLVHYVVDPACPWKNLKNAMRLIDDATLLSGRRSATYYLLKAGIHGALKEWKRSEKVLERCLVINPTIPLGNFLLMQVHLQTGNFAEAENDALYELDNNPCFCKPSLLLCSLALDAAKQNPAALKSAKRLFQLSKHLQPYDVDYSSLLLNFK